MKEKSLWDTTKAGPTLCSTCVKANVSCPVYPQDTTTCVEYSGRKVRVIGDGITPFQEQLGPTPKHYKYRYKGIKLDPYRILTVYNITDPAIQHAIKKLLRAGQSIKDLKQDIKEVIMSLERKLEMIEEDENESK